MCTAFAGMWTIEPARAMRFVSPIVTLTPPRRIIETCSDAVRVRLAASSWLLR